MLRTSATLAFCVFGHASGIVAHTVPTLVVEAEFSPSREMVLKVNLDPRLFLSAQPASLPPVPASWWFEQDEAAKAKSQSAASEFVDKHLTFRVGETPIEATWHVQPVDSASAFPLSEASAEVHLLAEHRGPLPDGAGGFKLSVSRDCAVAVILLNSLSNESDRRPQSLFPGETSRSFDLPPGSVRSEPPATTAPGATSGGATLVAGWWSFAHAWTDHLALAVLLGMTLHRRLWMALGLLMVFHGPALAASWVAGAGWLPPAPSWMQAAYWLVLAVVAVQLVVLKPSNLRLALAMFVAGLCHGLNLPHLHVDGCVGFSLLLRQEGSLLALESVALVAMGLGARGVQRLRLARGVSEVPAG